MWMVPISTTTTTEHPQPGGDVVGSGSQRGGFRPFPLCEISMDDALALTTDIQRLLEEGPILGNKWTHLVTKLPPPIVVKRWSRHPMMEPQQHGSLLATWPHYHRHRIVEAHHAQRLYVASSYRNHGLGLMERVLSCVTRLSMELTLVGVAPSVHAEVGRTQGRLLDCSKSSCHHGPFVASCNRSLLQG